MTQGKMVWYRRFAATYRFRLQGSWLDPWRRNLQAVTNRRYQTTSRCGNNPGNDTIDFIRGWSLRSWKLSPFMCSHQSNADFICVIFHNTLGRVSHSFHLSGKQNRINFLLTSLEEVSLSLRTSGTFLLIPSFWLL